MSFTIISYQNYSHVPYKYHMHNIILIPVTETAMMKCYVKHFVLNWISMNVSSKLRSNIYFSIKLWHAFILTFF